MASQDGLTALRRLVAERNDLDHKIVETARGLHGAGQSVVAIAQACGVHRVTVHRWLRETSPPDTSDH